MRRITPARLPETLAFLMRRRALSRLGTLGALAMSRKIHARSLDVQHPRIVSVGGALTEIVYALDAQACLVGVDSTSGFPSDAQLLPQVGYARSLSAEGILALSPTAVLVTEEAGPAGVLRRACPSRSWTQGIASKDSFNVLRVSEDSWRMSLEPTN
jgi:iron complex transport system substrate-binding protein